MNSLDQSFFRFLNGEFRYPLLDVTMPVISEPWFLGLVYFALLIVFCLLNYKTIKTGLPAGLLLLILLVAAGGLADFSGNMLKELILRPRPYSALQGVYYYQEYERTWLVTEPGQLPYSRGSMPSNHAATAMAVVVVLGLADRRFMPWLLALPLVVGWSRVYLARHYPGDVLGGMLLGLAWALLIWFAYKFVLKRLGRAEPLAAGRT